MLCLGIEGTAHTFGVGIVDSRGKVLAMGRTGPLNSLKNTFGDLSPPKTLKHKSAHLPWISKKVGFCKYQRA